MPIELARGVYWVGVVDWNLRDFHGYSTHRGTTYNAYLVVDEKVALIDTVKAPFYQEMLRRIREVVEPSRIDYVVSNHVEMDHSGSLPYIMKEANRARLVTSEKFGEAGLKKVFHLDWPLLPVKEGSEISLGNRKLSFVPLPMLHWPDSMATYLVDDAILFCNDAFGQHFASSRIFDDENDLGHIMVEATKYYANILMPMSGLVLRALEKVKGLKLNVIAPSHGVVWRGRRDEIVGAYAAWAKGGGRNKVLVVYSTMWGSTAMMAKAISEGLAAENVEFALFDLGVSDRSDIMAEMLTSRGIVVGSATINNGLLPSAAAFMAYLKGLKPVGKMGAAFGSFGWGGGAVKALEEDLKQGGVDIVQPGLAAKFVPDDGELEQCRAFGKALARRLTSG